MRQSSTTPDKTEYKLNLTYVFLVQTVSTPALAGMNLDQGYCYCVPRRI